MLKASGNLFDRILRTLTVILLAALLYVGHQQNRLLESQESLGHYFERPLEVRVVNSEDGAIPVTGIVGVRAARYPNGVLMESLPVMMMNYAPR